MKHKIVAWLIIIGFITNLGACLSTKEQAFKKIIPPSVISLNSQITISIPKMLGVTSGSNMPQETKILDEKNLHAGDFITVVIRNHSNDLIVFPSPDALRFFKYDEVKKQWVEINGVVTEYYWPTPPSEDLLKIYLYPNGADDSLGFVTLDGMPALDGIHKPERIRILVIGDIYSDDSPVGNQVGAYLDVTIKP